MTPLFQPSRPLSDPEYRALSGLLVAESGVYVFGLARAQGWLAQAGLCTAEGVVTAAGRAAHAAETLRRDNDRPLTAPGVRPLPDPGRHHLIAS